MELNLTVGYVGEAYAQHRLELAGYRVTPTLPNSKQGDLKVTNPETGEIVLVEIKTARRGVKGWQFCLSRPKGNYYKTDCTHADIVLLQLVGDSGLVVTYAIPSALLAGIKNTSFRRINPTKRNRWVGYLSDYRIFEGVV